MENEKNQSQEISPKEDSAKVDYAKRAAVLQMENIFEQVDAIRAEEKDTKEDNFPITSENNTTEIEMLTHKTLTDEEKEAEEQEFEKNLKKKNRSLTLKAVFAVVLAAIVIFGGYFCVDFMPRSKEGTIVVTIPQGAGTSKVAKELKANNLIHSEFLFKTISRIIGMDGKYNYGKFDLPRSAGYIPLFKALSSPGNVIETVRVTIPEGYEIYRIADTLEEKGLIDKDKFYYLIDNGNFDYDFIDEIPQREMRLEGYLFPDTYEFVPNDEYGIINEMLRRFEEIYLKYKPSVDDSYLNMDEFITLASIIEREAGGADKHLVSSVFHNRLKSSSYPYLQSCATVQYVLKERKPVLSIDDTKIDSPYNTYINKGLPIGPIASPGEQAIEAALNPAKTNYYFFVLGSDGKHHFSTTFNQHISNKNN